MKSVSRSTGSFKPSRLVGHSTHLLFVSVALALAATRAAAAAAPRPNVVFFLADDYGWADIGYHGNKAHDWNAVDTPTLDALAAAGVVGRCRLTVPRLTPRSWPSTLSTLVTDTQ